MKLETLGCTAAKVAQYNKKNIYTVEDLLKTFPRKYLDYRNPKMIKDLIEGEEVSIVLTLKSISFRSGFTDILSMEGVDSNGDSIGITFFNSSYLSNLFKENETYIFCGKVSVNNYRGVGSFVLINPTRYSQDLERLKKIVPVYSKIKNMSENYYYDKIQNAIALADKKEYLEPIIINKYDLMKRNESIIGMHLPKSPEEIELAKERVLFDDLFFYNYTMLSLAEKRRKDSPFRFSKLNKTKEFLKTLPYELTDGQKEVLGGIAKTTRENKRINAIVMGDVGCGKTLVAELAMLMACDGGFQSVLLAPTVVLATQHYADICNHLEPIGVRCGLLTSQTKAREKKAILKSLKEGEIDILVGTHSVLNPTIEYKNLALTVIDEEHKFGVKQREKFRVKAEGGVHNISMSATPIPRTLAFSMYGDDAQLYTIKTLPAGRKPIRTVYKKDATSSFEIIEHQLKQGRQAYIVCPLIESNDKEAMADVISAEEMCDKASSYFNPKGFKVAQINAKMKQDEISDILQKFQQKEFDILVSTTIIEVGVNIPNATVIHISNAERFGLAQLHQLRGRVGRGNYQGYCILSSDAKTEESVFRIRTMCETTDGFVVAQKDLELRGGGDFLGTTQKGDNKYVSLFILYEDLNLSIREEIKQILSDNSRRVWYDKRIREQYEEEYAEDGLES